MSDSSDEKKCPYCAETIKLEAKKCRYCGAGLNSEPSSEKTYPSENHPSAPKVAACPQCNVQLIAKEKKNSVSIAGIVGVLIFLVGLVWAFSNIVIGVLIMIFSLIVGTVGRGKKIVMVCPQCGSKGRVI